DQRSAGKAHMASADVVVGHLVAAPNVGKRASKSPCRWRHDLANHRIPMAYTCTPPTKTPMILGMRKSRECLRWQLGYSSYSSALASALPLSSPPPAMSTFPSGDNVAVCHSLPVVMLPVAVNVPAVGSYSSALVLPPSPPAMSTFPLGSNVAVWPYLSAV